MATHSITRTALYARISTRDKGQEVENQLAQLREFAARQGWTVVNEFIDRESGSTPDRKQFRAAAFLVPRQALPRRRARYPPAPKSPHFIPRELSQLHRAILRFLRGFQGRRYFHSGNNRKARTHPPFGEGEGRPRPSAKPGAEAWPSPRRRGCRNDSLPSESGTVLARDSSGFGREQGQRSTCSS